MYRDLSTDSRHGAGAAHLQDYEFVELSGLTVHGGDQVESLAGVFTAGVQYVWLRDSLFTQLRHRSSSAGFTCLGSLEVLMTNTTFRGQVGADSGKKKLGSPDIPGSAVTVAGYSKG